MPSSTQQPALPERAVRRGVGVVVDMTGRTVAYVRPTTGTRLRRLGALLLLVPVLAIVFVLAAILLAVLLTIAAFVAVALLLGVFIVRRRLSRASSA